MIRERATYSFLPADQYKPGQILIPRADITKRIGEMAEEIAVDHHPHDGVQLIGLLNGGKKFTDVLADQLRAVGFSDVGVQYMRVSTYADGVSPDHETTVESSGVVIDFSVPLIITDDIADSGNSLVKAQQIITPSQTAVLLDKPGNRVTPIVPNYVGFRIADDIWAQGMGMDWEGHGREYDVVYVGPWKEAPYSLDKSTAQQ